MKLNALLLPALSLLAASAFAGAPAKAPAPVQPPAEEPLGFTASIGYDSHYYFRGFLFAENLVTAAVDGTIPLNDMLSLNLSAWYGSSADDSGTYNFGGSFHELRLHGAVLADLGPVTVGAEYTRYFYDGSSTDFGALEDVNEVGIIIATTLGPVDVTGGAFYDDATDGFYFEVGVSHSWAVTDRISLVPAALISLGSDYYGVDGFNHVKVGLSAPIKLTKTATLTPYIAGNIRIEDVDDIGAEDGVYGGVSLSVSF